MDITSLDNVSRFSTKALPTGISLGAFVLGNAIGGPIGGAAASIGGDIAADAIQQYISTSRKEDVLLDAVRRANDCAIELLRKNWVRRSDDFSNDGSDGLFQTLVEQSNFALTNDRISALASRNIKLSGVKELTSYQAAPSDSLEQLLNQYDQGLSDFVRYSYPKFLAECFESELSRNDDQGRLLHNVYVRNQLDALTSFQPWAEYLITSESTRIQASIAEVAASISGMSPRDNPFVSVAEFFGPYENPYRVFNHSAPLVGREEHLNSLEQFWIKDSRVSVMAGSGGLGKSRILKEALTNLENSPNPPTVLVLHDAAHLSALAEEDLPSGAVVIAVDNSHRLKDYELRILLRLTQNQADRRKLVLSSRPVGLEALQRAIIDVHIAPESVTRIPDVAPLTYDQMRELALHFLSDENPDTIDDLLSIAGDSPLVTVVGASLLRRGEITSDQLRDSQFAAEEIFVRFEEVIKGELADSIPADRAKAILQLVAALSPFRADREDLVAAAAEFLSISPVVLIRDLGLLADAGALDESLNHYRVIPELLSQHILAKASLNSHGQRTGYVDEILNRFDTLTVESLLTNLVQVDPRGVIGAGRTLFDRVGLSLPVSCLDQVLVGLAPANHFGLPPLLNQLACRSEYRDESLDLLWIIGRDDPRSPDSNVDHPIRILTDLASLATDKLQSELAQILDAVNRWQQQPGCFGHLHSPIDVLDSLLSKTVTLIETGRRIDHVEYSVCSQGFAELRKRALRKLIAISRSDDPRVRLRSLDSLQKAIWRRIELAPIYVDGQEVDCRRLENEKLFEAILGLVETAKNPIILVGVISRQSVYKSSSSDCGRTIYERLMAEESIFGTKITRYLWYGRSQIAFHPDEKWEERAVLVDQEVADLAEETVDQFGSAGEVRREIEELLKQFKLHGVVDVSPGFFLEALVIASPQFAIDIVQEVLGDSSSQLRPFVSALLTPLWPGNRPECLRLAGEVVESDDPVLQRELARTLSLGSMDELEERELVQRLATIDDVAVTLGVLSSLKGFGSSERSVRDQIVAGVQVGGNLIVADALCEIYGPDEDVEIVTSEIWPSLQGKLFELETIPAFGETHDLVVRLAQQDPTSVADFMLNRVIYSRSLDRSQSCNYSAVPSTRLFALDVEQGDSERRKAELRRLANLVLEPGEYGRFSVARIFALFANGFDDCACEVIDEISREGLDGINAVILLAYDSPSGELSLALTKPEVVSRLLHRAKAIDENRAEMLSDQLISKSMSGDAMTQSGGSMIGIVNVGMMAGQLATQYEDDPIVTEFYKNLVEAADEVSRQLGAS